GTVTLPAIPRPAAVVPAEARAIKRDLTQTTVLMGRPSIRQDDPDYFPLAVATYVLGGGSVSRLYTRVREERGLAYSVYSTVQPARYGATYLIALQTRTDGVAEATRLIREEMSRLGREPVSAREIDLAKAYLIGSFPLRLDTSGKLARFLSGVEENSLGLDYPERYKERIAQVTAADVQRVAAKYLDPSTFSSVQVGR
ncbi:MAG TPA: insulinase family protein, partial [Candidatus Dormibacteraeota bacterium]|nr:insulinase family protein [Candidatus Dormibacteraeota bacterium]